MFGGPAEDVEGELAIFVTCCYIIKYEFIGALAFVPLGAGFDGAGIAVVKELDSFNDAAFIDIQAWYDSFGQHGKFRLCKSIHRRALRATWPAWRGGNISRSAGIMPPEGGIVNPYYK